MRRSTFVSTLVLAGVIASPALLNAQSNPTSEHTDATMYAERDDGVNWGWLGLLGLVGLFGLKRSDREKTHDQVISRVDMTPNR